MITTNLASARLPPTSETAVNSRGRSELGAFLGTALGCARPVAQRCTSRLGSAVPGGGGGCTGPGGRAPSPWCASPAPRESRLRRERGQTEAEALLLAQPPARSQARSHRELASRPGRARGGRGAGEGGRGAAGTAVRTGRRAAENDSAGEERPGGAGANAHEPGPGARHRGAGLPRRGGATGEGLPGRGGAIREGRSYPGGRGDPRMGRAGAQGAPWVCPACWPGFW